MKPAAPPTTLGLTAAEIVRVDRLAVQHGITREAMLTALASAGLDVHEMAARRHEAGPARPTDPMGEGWRSSVSPRGTPSPRLGWAILVLVGLVVGLGGWALVRVLDRRARPALPPVTTSTSTSSALPPPQPPPLRAPEPPPGPASSTITAASTPARRPAPPRPNSEIRDP